MGSNMKQRLLWQVELIHRIAGLDRLSELQITQRNAMPTLWTLARFFQQAKIVPTLLTVKVMGDGGGVVEGVGHGIILK